MYIYIIYLIGSNQLGAEGPHLADMSDSLIHIHSVSKPDKVRRRSWLATVLMFHINKKMGTCPGSVISNTCFSFDNMGGS